MITSDEALMIAMCLEGFFYGKMSVLCALTCTLAKEVQLFLGLGVYSGIFAMYLQCSSNKAIVFYALCLLYVLSTATIVSDLVNVILQVSNNPICKNNQFLSVVQWRISTLSLQLQNDSEPMMFRIYIIQSIVTSGCDFIAQCILVRIIHCTYHPF